MTGDTGTVTAQGTVAGKLTRGSYDCDICSRCLHHNPYCAITILRLTGMIVLSHLGPTPRKRLIQPLSA